MRSSTTVVLGEKHTLWLRSITREEGVSKSEVLAFLLRRFLRRNAPYRIEDPPDTGVTIWVENQPVFSQIKREYTVVYPDGNLSGCIRFLISSEMEK